MRRSRRIVLRPEKSKKTRSLYLQEDKTNNARIFPRWPYRSKPSEEMLEGFQDGLTGVRRPRKGTWRFVYTGRIQLGAGAHVHTGRIQLGAGAQCLLLIHENAAVVCRTRLETTSRFRACGLMWLLLFHAGKIKEGEKSPKNLQTWTMNRSSANWRDPPSGISEW